MECCRFVSVSACHGALDSRFTKGAVPTDMRLKRKRRAVWGGGALCLRIAATSTLPETPGSSRRRNYQEPRRLLPAENPNFQGLKPSLDSPSTSGRENEEADYTVQLTTSNEGRSSLSIPDAAIMISLIGGGGEALVRRILPVRENSPDDDVSLRFQRGAVDVVHFRGPNLGRISALWIAPEAGTWRLEQVTVTLTPSTATATSQPPPEKALFHTFNARDTLFGDGEETSALELKPSQVSECNREPQYTPPPKTPHESSRLRDLSMQEYSALKRFLLASTAGMVGVGTLGLYLLGAQDLAQGFAVGGVAGFVYLRLIQRAVDQLPGGEGSESWSSRLKTPVAAFALAVGLGLVATRWGQGSSSVVTSVTPQELVAGVLGFWVSKVAVLLAAFSENASEK